LGVGERDGSTKCSELSLLGKIAGRGEGRIEGGGRVGWVETADHGGEGGSGLHSLITGVELDSCQSGDTEEELFGTKEGRRPIRDIPWGNGLSRGGLMTKKGNCLSKKIGGQYISASPRTSGQKITKEGK